MTVDRVQAAGGARRTVTRATWLTPDNEPASA